MDRATPRESRRQTMSERREYPRFPAAWPVEISVEQYSLIGRAVDVSEYGICVVAAPSALLRVGDCYRVEVLAGGGARMAGTGVVRAPGSRACGRTGHRPPLPASTGERQRVTAHARVRTGRGLA